MRERILLSLAVITTLAALKAAPIKVDTISASVLGKTPISNLADGNIKFWVVNPQNPINTSGPKLGKEDGVEFVEVLPTNDNPNGVTESGAGFVKITKLPQPAPDKIKVSFQTRLTKIPVDLSWETKGMLPEVPRIRVCFAKDPNYDGGGIFVDLSGDDGKWVKHEETIEVPKGAQYLKLYVETFAGYKLAVGNWKVE
jgi:WD40 repeat protein